MKKLLLLFLGLSQISFAQFIPLNGPAGCDGGALYCANDSALVEVSSNCFRTTDGGVTWQDLSSNGLGNLVNPDCFARLGNTIYMGTNSGNRMYRTTDFGNTWTIYNDSLPTINGSPAAVPKIMVTSGNKVFLGGTNFGLRYTTSANDGWHIINIPGATGSLVEGLSVVGTDSLWLNIGAGGSNKIYFSINNGLTWTQATLPVISGVSVTDVIKVGNKILAGTSQGGFSSVFESSNYGTTWTNINPSVPIVKQLLKVNDSNIYGIGFDGLYQSTDQGATWTKIHSQNPQRISVWKTNQLLMSFLNTIGIATTSISPFNLNNISPAQSKIFGLEQVGGKLVVVHQGGMAIRDTGAVGVWQVVSNLKKHYTTYVNSMRKYNNTIYVCTDRGVYYTNNLGLSFDSIPALNGSNIQYYYRSVNLEIVTLFGISGIWGGIKRSTDGGITWANCGASGGLFGNAITNDIIAYNNFLFLGTNGTYAKSNDNGATWTLPGFFFINGAKFVVHNDSLFRLEISANSGNGGIIYRSSGNVTSWKDVTSNLPSTIPGNAFFIQPTGLFSVNNKLLAYSNAPQAGVDGCYEYSIATNLWTQIPNTGGLKINNPFMLQINGTYYAGTSGNSVWKTGANAVGIQDLTSKKNTTKLLFYPNPVRHQLTIKVNNFYTETFEVEITNAIGKTVLKSMKNRDDNTIDISNLETGIYFIRVKNNEIVYLGKFIKS